MERLDPRVRLGLRVGEVFSPAAPIDKAALFAGRIQQLRQVLDAVNQRGQHAIIFGERGVGKTSLANVLVENLRLLRSSVVCPHIICDSADDYASIWRKVFMQVELVAPRHEVGFQGSLFSQVTRLDRTLPEEIFSGEVRKALAELSHNSIVVIVMDEFDRIGPGATRSLLADTIKMLSDSNVPATLVLVGVADTVNDLIADHESVERALIQVPMPRMSTEELKEIVEKGFNALEMSIDEPVKVEIARLSRGLPHYTHLLAKNAARAAIDSGVVRVTENHLARAIDRALAEAQQSIISAFHKATVSTQTGNLYRQVLLACALASTDTMGFFAPADVREPMSKIMKEFFDIPRFQRHLNDFVSEGRGQILQRRGGAHRWRYRFRNPLMQPFVVMEGYNSGLIRESTSQ